MLFRCYCSPPVASLAARLATIPAPSPSTSKGSNSHVFLGRPSPPRPAQQSRTFAFYRIPPPPGKPPNLPPAKTKRYEVIHPEWSEPEDVKELLWRRQAYMHSLNSIRERFREEVEAQSRGEGSTLQMAEEENEEFESILRHNEDHNRFLGDQRKEREAEELKHLESDALAETSSYLKEEAAQLALREAEVERIRAEEPNYVTAENLEQRIEECLESPVDFSFAIDIEGHSYITGKAPEKYLTKLPGPKQKFQYEESAPAIRRTDNESENDMEIKQQAASS